LFDADGLGETGDVAGRGRGRKEYRKIPEKSMIGACGFKFGPKRYVVDFQNMPSDEEGKPRRRINARLCFHLHGMGARKENERANT
jgi:hypothetical protein